jgi:HAD superfamily phosphoserine phosphatase-like hydrolase
MAGEIKTAVFDLNGTLYNKSSKDEFFKFICSKRKSRLLKIFHMGKYTILQKMHAINQTEFKENFFCYLDGIPPQQVEAYAKEFWQKEFPGNFNAELLLRIGRLKKEGVKVFCITGALELYVQPLFELYKDMEGYAGTLAEYEDDKYTIIGEACKGEVKLQRLEQMLGTSSFRIVEAYSDMAEDILDAAEKSWLVKDGQMKRYKW